MVAQAAQKRGIFGQPFRHDIPRAFQCRFRIRHRLGQIPRRKHRRLRPPVGKNGIDQALQPVFPRDHRLGAPLWLVGQVDVFQLRLGDSLGDRARQRIGHLALLGDRPCNRRPPRLQLAQVSQPFGQVAQLGVVKPARHLLAIPRDEGDRRAFVQQGDRGAHLIGVGADLGGDGAGYQGQRHANPPWACADLIPALPGFEAAPAAASTVCATGP